MRRCYCSVILSLCVVLLCRVVPGECQFSAVTVPEPGLHGFFPGTQNITLICEISNSNGDRHATTWSKQTSEDREEGRGLQSITAGNNDGIFTISSRGTVGPSEFPDTSELTIVSLGEELDDTTIFCVPGGEDPVTNFTIRIYYPPALRGVVGEVRKRENEELSMDMAEPGSPPPFPFPSQVSWTKDGEEVESQLSTRVFNYSSIFIGSVQPSDSGLYLLSATNFLLDSDTILGSDIANFTLNVLFGAGFAVRGPETVVVVEGGMATLICGTGLSGNPLPIITWTDNHGRVVATGGERVSLSSGRNTVSLSLNSVRENDTGYWNCSAQVYDDDVVVGGPVEWNIQLVVVVPPVAPVDLSAKQFGATWIYLQWFNPSNGRGSPPLSSHVITVQEVGGQSTERTFGGEGAANVTGLLPGTEYTFSVVAVSQFQDVLATSPPSGPANGTTSLTVPAPVCSDAPRVQDRRLVVNWTFLHSGGGPLTSVNVYYTSSVDSTRQYFFMDPQAAVGTGEREDSIPLPEAGLTYYFTVTASNDQGSSGNNCPPITLDIGIPARPDPPVVESAAGGSVVVRLKTLHSGVSDSSTDQFRFILLIRDVGDMTVAPIEREVSQESCGRGPCEGSLALTSGDRGLNEGTTYIVSVSASNRYGQSQESGNSDPFPFGAGPTSTGTTPSGDTTSSSSTAGMVVGGVVGGLLILVLLVLIVALTLFILLRMRTKRTSSYKVQGGGQGVRVEEVDVGKELTSDPNKELHYADLEQFQQPPGHAPNRENNLNHTIRDEPVQYATLAELNPKAAAKAASGGEGEETVGVAPAGEGTGEREGGGEGDKAMTSSTFV